MRRFWLTAAFLGAASLALAKAHDIPVSTFRKYFWGAREAYEQRDYKKAERLMRTYRDLGSPTDRMLKQAGCDTAWEVSLFSKALKEEHACMNRRSKSASWDDAERAKFAILMALRRGDAASLIPYVDCAPNDLVQEATTCGTHVYRVPEDITRLAAALQKIPDALTKPDWRRFPVAVDDKQNIRWVLYTESDQWKPCGMATSPLISLRQDPSGQIRIAGFAAACLEGKP